MNILGVYSGHDAHFCLLQDGRITRHYQVDRFTRMKHSIGYHEHVLIEMLSDAGLRWHDIDAVVCGGNLWVKPGSPSTLYDVMQPIELAFVAQRGGANGPQGRPRVGDASERLVVGTVTHQGHSVPMYQVDHHLAHCAQAYYMSPFDKAVVFSFDGGGDDAYMLSCTGQGNKLTALEYNGGNVYPKRLAIGNFWTLILKFYAAWAGGSSVDGEGKIMGHAAYGVPRPEMLQAVLSIMRSEIRWYDCTADVELRRLGVDWSDWNARSLKDFSASLQRATEILFVDEVQNRVAREQLFGGERAVNVCLGGGCAYNCVANGEVALRYPSMYVPSCPNDAGLAVGACLLVWHHVMGNEFHGVHEQTPFLGVGRDGHADEAVAGQVVADILSGKLVAWFDGRAESGNRALGHRSILADPRLPNVREIINQKVKKREWFRPFAPSVLAGHEEWLAQSVLPASWYMSFSVGVDPAWVTKIPGVVHVDGTCRPHVVTQAANPVYWQIIEQFRQATGIPLILNTSFNIQEPIIETEAQARATFARSGLDVLYVNGVREERG